MTIDKQKLQAAAEACGSLPWRFEQLSICKFGIRDDHGYIAFLETGHPAQYGSHPDREAKARFLGEMTPATVLALLAEVEGLRTIAYGVSGAKRVEMYDELARLRVENERLRKLPTCWSEVIEQSEANDDLLDKVLELSADAERYRRMRLATLKQLDETPDEFDAEFDRQLGAALGNGAQP